MFILSAGWKNTGWNDKYSVKRFFFNWMKHFCVSNLCWIIYWADYNASQDCRYMQHCQNGQNKAFSCLLCGMLHCQWCFQGRKLNRIWMKAAALASSSSPWHCSLNPFITISRCMQMSVHTTNHLLKHNQFAMHLAEVKTKKKCPICMRKLMFFNKKAAAAPEDNRSLLSASVCMHLCAQNNTSTAAKWWNIESQTCFSAKLFCMWHSLLASNCRLFVLDKSGNFCPFITIIKEFTAQNTCFFNLVCPVQISKYS